MESVLIVDFQNDPEVRKMGIGEIHGHQLVGECQLQFATIQSEKPVRDLILGDVGVHEHRRMIRA